MSFAYSDNRYMKLANMIIGSAIYAFGINFFITPLNLYTSGVPGFSQLLNTLLNEYILRGDTVINVYGAIYFLINIPLFVLAWFKLGKRFFIKTFICTTAISFFMGAIPVPQIPVIEDYLTSVMLGGIISGFGIGIVLTAGGSGGGLDIVGVWFAKKYRNFSVGKLTLYVNIVLFATYLILFDISTVIYCLINMVFYMIILDRVHYQNINVRLMIFTKKEGIDHSITQQTGRGVTEWQGTGAYTNQGTHVLITVINKYELHHFLDIIHEIDPVAFTIVDEGVHVYGNFEKRL